MYNVLRPIRKFSIITIYVLKNMQVLLQCLTGLSGLTFIFFPHPIFPLLTSYCLHKPYKLMLGCRSQAQPAPSLDDIYFTYKAPKYPDIWAAINRTKEKVTLYLKRIVCIHVPYLWQNCNSSTNARTYITSSHKRVINDRVVECKWKSITQANGVKEFRGRNSKFYIYTDTAFHTKSLATGKIFKF